MYLGFTALKTLNELSGVFTRYLKMSTKLGLNTFDWHNFLVNVLFPSPFFPILTSDLLVNTIELDLLVFETDS